MSAVKCTSKLCVCIHSLPVQFHPPVIGRAQCGFVGLRNAGATCYMNSVLQQLYMQPTIREVCGQQCTALTLCTKVQY